MPFDPLDHLDASLNDFDSRSPAPPHFAYPSHHSGFLKSDTESDMHDSTMSAGGYSPPAWRRLGNGDRSSGFWRKGDNLLGYGGLPPNGYGYGYGRGLSRESSPEYDSADDEEGDAILAAAIRTRLPTGSMSPEKERSPEPDYLHKMNGGPRIKSEEPSMEEMKATLAALPPHKDDSDNCIATTSFPLVPPRRMTRG